MSENKKWEEETKDKKEEAKAMIEVDPILVVELELKEREM